MYVLLSLLRSPSDMVHVRMQTYRGVETDYGVCRCTE